MTLAENGVEVLAAMRRQRFDMVLMDIQMPEMDGLEATAAIRREEAFSGAHIPIVAMTANAMHGDRETCLAHGMDGYVSKPIKRSELLAAIELHRPNGKNYCCPGPNVESAVRSR